VDAVWAANLETLGGSEVENLHKLKDKLLADLSGLPRAIVEALKRRVYKGI